MAITGKDFQTCSQLLESHQFQQGFLNQILVFGIKTNKFLFTEGQEMVTEIIISGSCENARDKSSHNKTALQLALEKKDTNIADILLEQGADPFLIDTIGQNSLHTLLCSGIAQGKVEYYLIHHFLSEKSHKRRDFNEFINKKRKDHPQTPLGIAFSRKNQKVICCLIKTDGMDIQGFSQESTNNTAFHVCVVNKHLEAIKILMQKFYFAPKLAEWLGKKNKERKTALQIAQEQSHVEIINELEKCQNQQQRKKDRSSNNNNFHYNNNNNNNYNNSFNYNNNNNWNNSTFERPPREKNQYNKKGYKNEQQETKSNIIQRTPSGKEVEEDKSEKQEQKEKPTKYEESSHHKQQQQQEYKHQGSSSPGQKGQSTYRNQKNQQQFQQQQFSQQQMQPMINSKKYNHKPKHEHSQMQQQQQQSQQQQTTSQQQQNQYGMMTQQKNVKYQEKSKSTSDHYQTSNYKDDQMMMQQQQQQQQHQSFNNFYSSSNNQDRRANNNNNNNNNLSQQNMQQQSQIHRGNWNSPQQQIQQQQQQQQQQPQQQYRQANSDYHQQNRQMQKKKKGNNMNNNNNNNNNNPNQMNNNGGGGGMVKNVMQQQSSQQQQQQQQQYNQRGNINYEYQRYHMNNNTNDSMSQEFQSQGNTTPASSSSTTTTPSQVQKNNQVAPPPGIGIQQISNNTSSSSSSSSTNPSNPQQNAQNSSSSQNMPYQTNSQNSTSSNVSANTQNHHHHNHNHHSHYSSQPQQQQRYNNPNNHHHHHNNQMNHHYNRHSSNNSGGKPNQALPFIAAQNPTPSSNSSTANPQNTSQDMQQQQQQLMIPQQIIGHYAPQIMFNQSAQPFYSTTSPPSSTSNNNNNNNNNNNTTPNKNMASATQSTPTSPSLSSTTSLLQQQQQQQQQYYFRPSQQQMTYPMQYISATPSQQNPMNTYAIPNNKVMLQNSENNSNKSNNNNSSSNPSSNPPPPPLPNGCNIPPTLSLNLTNQGQQALMQSFQHQQPMLYSSTTAYSRSSSSTTTTITSNFPNATIPNASLQPPPPPTTDYFILNKQNLQLKKELQSKQVQIQDLYKEITKLRTQMKQKERTNSQITELLDRLSRTPKQYSSKLPLYQPQLLDSQQQQQQQQQQQLHKEEQQKDSNNLTIGQSTICNTITPPNSKLQPHIKSRSLYEICQQKNDYFQQFASHPSTIMQMKKVILSFSNEIYEFSRQVQERLQDQRPMKDAVIKKATQIIKMAIPNADVQVYGSHATELCLPWSDIDLVVNLPNGLQASYQSRSKLEEVQYKMRETKQFVKQCTLIKAAIPVLKLVCQDKDFGGFNVDITIQDQRHNGLRCVSLVKTFLHQYQSLKPMVLMLKELLKNSSQNNPFKGGLSSYGLTLLCIWHLERRPPAPLGETLISFLFDFGFNYNSEMEQVQVKLPPDYMNRNDKFEDKMFNSPYFNQSAKCPMIIDPLSNMNNVGKSAYNFYYIQKIFARAYFAGIAEIRYRVIENISTARSQNNDSLSPNNQRLPNSGESNNSCNNSSILSSPPLVQQLQTRKLVSKSVLECIVTSASDLFDCESKYSVLMYYNEHATPIQSPIGGNNYNQFVALNSLTPGSSNTTPSGSSSQQPTQLQQHLGYNPHHHHHHQHHHQNNSNFFSQNYGGNLPQTFAGMFAQNMQNNPMFMGQGLGGSNGNNGGSSLSPNSSDIFGGGNMY